MIVVEDVHRIHQGSDTSVYYNNCAGDMTGENVPNVGCSGSEPAGKVKRMVEKTLHFHDGGSGLVGNYSGVQAGG